VGVQLSQEGDPDRVGQELRLLCLHRELSLAGPVDQDRPHHDRLGGDGKCVQGRLGEVHLHQLVEQGPPLPLLLRRQPGHGHTSLEGVEARALAQHVLGVLDAGTSVVGGADDHPVRRGEVQGH